MRRSYLFITFLVLLCACHTSRQVQTHTHAEEHSSDTMSVIAVATSHRDSSVSEIISNIADINVDIEEVIERLDSAGRVTERKTKRTKVQRKDSTNTNRGFHKALVDSVHYNKTHHSRKDAVSKADTSKKFKLGSISTDLFLGIVILIVLLLAIKFGKKIWEHYKLI